MLTVFSLIPILIPALVAWVILLVNQNRMGPDPEQLENWDNGMTSTVLRRTL